MAVPAHRQSWRPARRRGSALVLAALLVLGGFGSGIAQNAPVPRPDPRQPAAAPEPAATPSNSEAATQNLERELNQRTPLTAAPATTGLEGRQDRRVLLDYEVTARLVPNGEPVTDGIVWRVFGAIPGGDGKLPLIGEAQGGTLSLTLDPGEYLIHAAFGRAVATKRISVSQFRSADEIVLNAGGMRLAAFLGEGKQLAADQASFEIYEEDEEFGERLLIIPNAKPGQIIRLNAGLYHVVSRYGSSNAVVRADISVAAGKLTEAQILHKAARVTLKLVSQRGGEALADTSWRVQTPAGDVVVESIGAFPSVILTEGEYVAVARHDGQSYERPFTVETDINRDIEVLAQR